MLNPETGQDVGGAAQAAPTAATAPAKKLITVSSHGITAELDQEKFNDLELFDMIDDIQSGNVFKMPKLMKHIFDDQHKEVLNGLRSENGIVTADKASEFLIEVLKQIGPNFSRS
jgi:hypothetical protein